jgi:hypothetical protein
MDANEDKLSISRKEMTEHLTLFFTHVRYTLTLMLSMFTSAIVSLGFGLKEFGSENHLVMYVILASSIILLVVFFVSQYATELVRRYYKLYVSSYVYAARLHDSCASEKHPWFTDIMNRVTDIHDSKAVDEFIENENAEDNHSWHYYQKFIDYLGKGSLIVGIAMLICFFWNVILK